MKQLILILISCLAFAQEPQKPDTSNMSEELKAVIVKVEVEKQKAEVLEKKLSAAEKENQQLKNKRLSLYSRFKYFIKEYFGPEESNNNLDRPSAVKEENRTDPVHEIEVYDGQDTIRAGWFYRLFHKNDYIIRRYKIENNEKIYLD